MKSGLNYLPLATINHRLLEADFLKAIAGISLWNESNVMITEITGEAYPVQRGQAVIASRHGIALSWLFQELKTQTFFTELFDPEVFYRYLVKAVWRYQMDQTPDANPPAWETELDLDSLPRLDSLCANSPPWAIARMVQEEESPIGLLQAVLAAASRLFMREFVDLFVYGSLMQGESNHHLLEQSQYLGEDAIAQADLFNLGPYPMLVPGRGTVYGECYSIPLRIIPRLDQLEDHPHYYQRRWMQFKSGKTRLVYQGFVSHIQGCSQILSGSWRHPHPIEEK
jgi:gamma-glutamylcyclotransferase (GGCT)/AIG2-like uncharacterized protein YtfP